MNTDHAPSATTASTQPPAHLCMCRTATAEMQCARCRRHACESCRSFGHRHLCEDCASYITRAVEAGGQALYALAALRQSRWIRHDTWTDTGTVDRMQRAASDIARSVGVLQGMLEPPNPRATLAHRCDTCGQPSGPNHPPFGSCKPRGLGS